jgi:hypothetical protein
MAGRRETDGKGDSARPGVPPLHRDGGRDRRGHSSNQVREDMRAGDVGADTSRTSDRRGPARATPPVDVAPVDEVKLWLPSHGSDLSIYKRMLRLGAIKPYAMPDGIERLAEHLMQMLEMAQASGRNRDAIKCIEILRLLQADNRALALELDKIERLDAGKPTSISGQVAPEVQDRIKRIVSTQRMRANTETNNAGEPVEAHAQGNSDGSGGGGFAAPGQAESRPSSAGGDHAAAQDDRGAGAPHPATGGGR